MGTDHQQRAIDSVLASMTVSPRDIADAVVLADRIGGILCKCKTIRAKETRLSGSLAKGTAIRPLNDIDVIVLLDPATPYTDPDRIQPVTLISRIRARIKQSQTRSVDAGTRSVEPQDHSTRLNMGDLGPHIDFVPAFARPGGYLQIAEKSSASYILTSIDRQIQALDTVSRRAPGLRGGVMLLKAWRRAAPRRVYLGSYALELLALHAVERGAVTARQILESTLGVMAETRLRLTLTGTHRLQTRARLCEIRDVAVPSNNVVGHLTARHLDTTARYATESLERWTAARSPEAAIRALIGRTPLPP